MLFTSTSAVALAAIAGLVAASPLPEISSRDNARPKEKINPLQYLSFQRYAKFASAAGPSYCDVPPYGTAVHSYINVVETQTQATLFRDDDAQEFILAFPGSSQTYDYTTTDPDAKHHSLIDQPNCRGCIAHQGFYKAWVSAIDTLLNTLDAALHEHKDYQITIAGYSLGAALTSLAYSMLNDQHYPIKAAYTYGEPRVGNQKYADHIDELSGASDSKAGNYFRITHSYDGIPQTPGEDMGFVHSRTEYWEADPEGPDNTYRCFGQEAGDCNKGHAGAMFNDAHYLYSGVRMPQDHCHGQ